VVRAALGLGRHHLFGNSWGGWLALQYTLERRPQLASLILSSVAHCGGPIRSHLLPAMSRNTATCP
jgi:pimeloyl-ACP methyl ester carboxylesterase